MDMEFLSGKHGRSAGPIDKFLASRPVACGVKAETKGEVEEIAAR
jgi:hypothetical protein